MTRQRRMKTVRAWALVWNNGDMYGDHTDLLKTKRKAVAMLRAHQKSGACVGGEFVDRIARVEIREVQP